MAGDGISRRLPAHPRYCPKPNLLTAPAAPAQAPFLTLLMHPTTTRTCQLPDTATWLLAATLLLGLLGLGSLARPAAAPAHYQSSTRPTNSNPAQIISSSWRPSAP